MTPAQASKLRGFAGRYMVCRRQLFYIHADESGDLGVFTAAIEDVDKAHEAFYGYIRSLTVKKEKK